MNLEETLKLIAAAQGKPDQLALATVEIVLAGQPAEDRDALRAAIDAAAVPHWFDAALLAQLLDPELAGRADELFARLAAFPFTERFAARGETACNVHEATRLPWRVRLHQEQPDRFRELSRRAATMLPSPEDRQASPTERIESLYHRLVSSPPEEAARHCEALGREWRSAGRTVEQQALAGALGELEQTGLLPGIVRAVALMELADIRWGSQPLAATVEAVGAAYALAESLADQRRMARALELRGQLSLQRGEVPAALHDFERCLALRGVCRRQQESELQLQAEEAEVHCCLGDAWVSQGALSKAVASYGAYRAGFEKLVALDPANTGWQRDLAVSNSRVGDALLQQGDLAGATDFFNAYLAGFEKLAVLDPANVAWQRELAVGCSKVADVRLARGDLPGASAAFEADLAISQKLAALDPANAYWQRDLAVSHSKVGDVRLAQGDLPGAGAAYEAAHAINQKLAAIDPSNSSWHLGLAISHSKAGDVRLAEGDLLGAGAAFEAALIISQKLSSLDSANANWQRNLAISHGRVGDARLAQGDLPGALAAFDSAQSVLEKLAVLDLANADWQRELAVGYSKVGYVRQMQGDLAGARAAFEADLAISQKLAARDPANAGWQADLAVTLEKLGSLAGASGDLESARQRWSEALAIFLRLTELDATNVPWRDWAEAVRQSLRSLPPGPA